jgi:hypothetical protein
MSGNFDHEPQFCTMLADNDGFCRWVVTLRNYDTGDKAVDLLITLHSDDGLTIATRPPSDSSCTWSPPTYPTRV